MYILRPESIFFFPISFVIKLPTNNALLLIGQNNLLSGARVNIKLTRHCNFSSSFLVSKKSLNAISKFEIFHEVSRIELLEVSKSANFQISSHLRQLLGTDHFPFDERAVVWSPLPPGVSHSLSPPCSSVLYFVFFHWPFSLNKNLLISYSRESVSEGESTAFFSLYLPTRVLFI